MFTSVIKNVMGCAGNVRIRDLQYNRYQGGELVRTNNAQKFAGPLLLFCVSFACNVKPFDLLESLFHCVLGVVIVC